MLHLGHKGDWSVGLRVRSKAAREVIIGRLIGHRAGLPGSGVMRLIARAACDALGNKPYIARIDADANSTAG
jgi:hypothetical protein